MDGWLGLLLVLCFFCCACAVALNRVARRISSAGSALLRQGAAGSPAHHDALHDA